MLKRMLLLLAALLVLTAAHGHKHRKVKPKRPPADSTTATVRTSWGEVKRIYR